MLKFWNGPNILATMSGCLKSFVPTLSVLFRCYSPSFIRGKRSGTSSPSRQWGHVEARIGEERKGVSIIPRRIWDSFFFDEGRPRPITFY